MEAGGGRPDFTFFLPNGLRINMDVKFPFDNYLRYLETNEDGEKARRKDRFLKDVRARVREITTREYINPEDNTLDYALLFIPNENVYSFIQEEDTSLLDDALKTNIILCSPLTLYAILAVIRQSVESFNLEKVTSQILAHMAAFQKQWEAFIRSMDKMGKRIEDAKQEFDHLVSTRKNQLERPLKKIEKMRQEQGMLPASEAEDDEVEEEGRRPRPSRRNARREQNRSRALLTCNIHMQLSELTAARAWSGATPDRRGRPAWRGPRSCRPAADPTGRPSRARQ